MRPGDRIAQVVFESIVHPHIVVADEIKLTARGECGFGSSGVGVLPAKQQ